MEKHLVGICRYAAPSDSISEVVDLAGGLSRIPRSSKVFIKPNIVFWGKSIPFPKWGVITTSRVVADIVKLLVDYGLEDITIGEGTVVFLIPKTRKVRKTRIDTLVTDLWKNIRDQVRQCL